MISNHLTNDSTNGTEASSADCTALFGSSSFHLIKFGFLWIAMAFDLAPSPRSEVDTIVCELHITSLLI